MRDQSIINFLYYRSNGLPVFALIFSPTCPKAKFRKIFNSFKQVLS